jgi:cell volume regulation protein A
MLGLFGQQLGIGLAVGLAVGPAAVWTFRRIQLSSPGLYPVASLATAALSFGAADALHGSGFLAVYLAGLALGSADIPAKRTVVAFHEGIAWVAQLGMFLTLGLLVFPSRLGDVWLEGTLLALVIVFLARPLATLLTMQGIGFNTREKALLGWAGLRGAVPVVLATFPVIDGVPQSKEFFSIVFFAVLLSTVVQGTTIEPVARLLGVTTSEDARPASIVEVGTVRELGGDVLEHVVRDGDAAAGALIRYLGLPREALVSLIVRGDEVLLPRGSTRIEAGDRMLILVRSEVSDALPELLARWRTGPIGPPPRPARRYTGSVPIFTTRPWGAEDGDPAHPAVVAGHAVVEQLRERRDVPGALVVLADGRYAVTGPIMLIGPAQQLQQQVRRRLAAAADDSERAWWQEVVGACAL